jgi:hypothetical protein
LSKGFKFFEKEGAKFGGCTKLIIAELSETGDHEVGPGVVEDIPLQAGAISAASPKRSLQDNSVK